MMAAAASIATNPWLSKTVRIGEITEEAPGIFTYEFEFPDPSQAKSYRFSPGQFNMIYLPGFGESAISLSAHPASRERWAHTIRVAGNVTRELSRLSVGETLGLRGPYGSSWPIERATAADVVLVASGTATLEAALFKRPMVIAYRTPRLSAWLIRRKGIIPWVGLPNILAGETLVPELLQQDVRPRILADAVLSQLNDSAHRAMLAERFTSMHHDLKRDTAVLAADIILSVARQ
jgi:lipid-A-disaccharide synthase